MNFDVKTCHELRKVLQTINVPFNCLEISPFYCPLLSPPSKTFDVLTKSELIKLCEGDSNISDKCVNIRDVDYVSSTGDLRTINTMFDLVVSSHCIEHTPDLLQHLSDVEYLLNEHGQYVCFIPHRLYTFDHYKPCKSAADVLEAHILQKKRPSLKTFIETQLYTTHNDCSRHWKNDNGSWNTFNRSDLDNLVEAYRIKELNQEYTSLHNWHFTLQEFLCVFAILKQLQYLPRLEIANSIDVHKNSHEFCVVFRKV